MISRTVHYRADAVMRGPTAFFLFSEEKREQTRAECVAAAEAWCKGIRGCRGQGHRREVESADLTQRRQSTRERPASGPRSLQSLQLQRPRIKQVCHWATT